MERLYPPLAAISRGIDHIIMQNVISLLMIATFAFVVAGIWHRLVSVEDKLKALLTDTSNWKAVADARFNVLPSGQVECWSPDGIRRFRSIAALDKFLSKRLKDRGQAFDRAAMDALLELDPPGDRALPSSPQAPPRA